MFFSSTRQTAGACVSFAADASFSALRFAARPTISIRSGISRATFNALSPIDPVAPRTTTRLGFIFSTERTESTKWNSEGYGFGLWTTEFLLKLQSLSAEIHKQTFVDIGCDEVIHKLNFMCFRKRLNSL